MSKQSTVQAAGGVVVRRTPDGTPEVLLVHRPRYDDWSIPKGKLEPGETHEAAAVREVEEETGVLTALGEELPSSRYVDRHGRDKLVRYWLMTPVTQSGWVPNDEIDDVVWVSADDADRLLTYDADRRLLADALREGRGGTP